MVYIIQTPGLSWQTSTSVCIKKGHVLINVGPTPDAQTQSVVTNARVCRLDFIVLMIFHVKVSLAKS